MVPVEKRSVALRTCRLRLAQSLFSLFANKVRTAGPIGMGEALIDMIRSREDDCAHRESMSGTWHSMPLGTLFIFSLSRIPSERLVRSEWERQ